jgi:hypothetical protein
VLGAPPRPGHGRHRQNAVSSMQNRTKKGHARNFFSRAKLLPVPLGALGPANGRRAGTTAVHDYTL